MSTTNVNEQDINEQDIKDAAGALMHNDTRIKYPVTNVLRKNTKGIARRHVGGDRRAITLTREAEHILLINDMGVDHIPADIGYMGSSLSGGQETRMRGNSKHAVKLLRAALYTLMFDIDTGERADFEILDEDQWRLVKETAAQQIDEG